jgi:hypothetical protein
MNILLEWYPTKWPTYSIQLMNQKLRHTYKSCSVIKSNDGIEITVRGCVINLNPVHPVSFSGGYRVFELFSPYLDEILSAKDNVMFLIFRIFKLVYTN